MKPKWQRARIINAHRLYKYLEGRELWVKCGPPVMESTYDVVTGEIMGQYPTLETNQQQNGIAILCAMNTVELLPDFADDVPLIPFEDWLAQEQMQ